MAHASNIAAEFKEMLGRPEDGQALYDFILATDESTTDANWVGLMASGGDDSFSEGRTPVIGQRVSSGQFVVEDRDPLSHLVWRQDDWSGGALCYETGRSNNCYLKGNMDASAPGVIGPGIGKNFGGFRGNTRQPIGWLLRNPHFESDAADGWTDNSGGSGTVDFQSTTQARSTLFGNQSAEIVWTGTTADVDIFSQTLANPTVYQGKSLTIACYFKKTAGSGGVQIEIADGVGTTRGTGVTTATDWTLVTCTRTIDGAASAITITLETENTSTFTGYTDDFTAYSTSTTGTPLQLAVLDQGEIYTYAGRIVAKLDTSVEDQFKWDAVYIGDADATDIITFQDSSDARNVFVGFGASNAYIYGSDTSWTASTIASTGKNAIKWAISRNDLWKTDDGFSIQKTQTPLNAGGAWTEVARVGNSDHPIVRMYDFLDTVVVGKEDGLWAYLERYPDGASADLFRNLTNEFRHAPSEFHFRAGAPYIDNALYLGLGNSGGLMRIAPNGNLEDISRLILRPESFEVNGKVWALASDSSTVWAFVDNELLSFNYNASGTLVAHTKAEAGSVSPKAFVASQGSTVTDTKSAGTGDDPTSSSLSWQNESNILASDDADATVTWPSGYNGVTGEFLFADNFGFTVPAAATISGITVTIERGDSVSGGTKDSVVQLLKAGSSAGDNKARAASWPGADTAQPYGGVSDLWNTTWTPADINNADFGVQLKPVGNTAAAHVSSVDHISITVTYFLAGSSSDVILPRAVGVTNWDVSGVICPHLLGIYAGTDTTDTIPYVITDCWALPHEGLSNINASSDLPPAPATQKFYTSKWDADAPTELKVASHLEVRMSQNDVTQPFAVSFGTNNSDNASTSLGTLDGGEAVQTLYFGDITDYETATVFYDIGLYFEGTFTGSKQKARIHAFELHAYPVIEIIKNIRIRVQVGGALLHNSTDQDDLVAPDVLSADIAAFEEKKATFFLIEDQDRDGIPTSHPVVMRPGELVKTRSQGGMVWEMVFQGTLAIS